MNISFIVSVILKFIISKCSISLFSNFNNRNWNFLFHSYLLFDFDRNLYKYNIFNLIKACQITLLIYYIFINILSDVVSSSIREGSFRKPWVVRGSRNRYVHVRLRNDSKLVWVAILFLNCSGLKINNSSTVPLFRAYIIS